MINKKIILVTIVIGAVILVGLIIVYYPELLGGAVISCSDSDGGKDYYVKGTVKGMSAVRGSIIEMYAEQTDSCSKWDENELIEYYCDGKYVWPVMYECPNGCGDGACKK